MVFKLISGWLGNHQKAATIGQDSDRRSSCADDNHWLGEGRRLEADGRSEEAVDLYSRVLATDPSNAHALYRLGKLLARLGRFDEATNYLGSALAKDPDLGEARIVQANIHLSKNDFASAKYQFELAGADRSASSALLSNYGLALYGSRDFSNAREILEKAISLDPACFEAHLNLGLLHNSNANSRDAEKCFRIVLDLNPRHGEAVKQLCQLLLRTGRSAEALDIAEKSLRAAPSLAEARQMAGYGHFEAGSFNKAEAYLRKAIEAGEHEEVLTYLARTLQNLGRHAEAIEFYEKALQLNSGYIQGAWHRSLLQLQVGNYSEGWADYEHRLLSEDPPPRHLPIPRWDGEPSSDAHLLIYAEQGLGDQIMFCSCIPDVLSKVGRCTIECSNKLEALMRRSFPQCDVIGTEHGDPATWFDRVDEPTAALPMGSLPMFFRQRADSFPTHHGYLVPDPAKVHRWKQALSTLGPEPKIGISWVGGSPRSRQSHRSIPLSQWEPILSIPGVKFVSLQYTHCQPELEMIAESFGVEIHHWQQAIDNYDDTAALVCGLDLVISVQTAIIHLCGAVGRPAWVLVPVCAEWRYGSTKETMDWYPSVRLFRQKQLGDWNSVVRNVSQELALHVQQRDKRSDQ